MPKAQPKRIYSWRRSPEDERDYKFNVGPHNLATVLPEVDPRADHRMPIVYDQGQLGSCTANAVAAAVQYNRGLLLDHKAKRPSRLDIYYGERSIEGTLGQGDTGAYGRDGFKFAQKTGWLREIDWPYDINEFEVQPPAGPRIKLEQPYASVTPDVDHFKVALSNQQTVAFGFTVFESFESQEVADTGVVPMPAAGERQLGGHEVLIVGYLASHPEHALVRNSWGPDWGMAGYFLMPWAYITDTNLSGDWRTIVR